VATYSTYDTNKKDSYRYTLGDITPKTLFCFGINPSTANNMKLDNTVTRVRNFSSLLGFQSFLMLNICAQRSTNPNNLNKRLNKKEHLENLKYIDHYIKDGSTIWAAWGNLITKRDYLYPCLFDIYELLKAKKLKWIKYGELTTPGHPKHPLMLKHSNEFNRFNIHQYLKDC